MADEKKPAPATDNKADAKPASAAAKKAKPPAVESKPLPEFMAQDCLPLLIQKLEEQGIAGLDLKFETRKIAVRGYQASPDCWQIVGQWEADAQTHQFNVYFFDGELQGQRGFSYSLGGVQPSTMESFRIDERRMSLNLLVSGVLQRLNSQKWLNRN
ncbi:DUF2996 domain-containing protein [filamentous cyanobacterium LEGE 11480]|uniref:DUF2996 domain-containing protein n=1 Tax=Romeriopsis navalis LEGE 11480 TaxID=2777977 RepID=A0A928VI16_9CYAN|nr:DUF2996 domain-containing protein [Romeriopsis navalis]MBE9028148.1 DUF2996 domain-containing protein [Romeriopsis navalis LEGE 11480]